MGNSLSTENFIFLKRFTDAFLGVEQRYELGGGIILAKYSKISRIGAKTEKNLNKVEFSAENFDRIMASGTFVRNTVRGTIPILSRQMM